MSKFEDLVVFQRASELMVAVYRATESFPSAERFGLTSQLRRAAVGIMSNIAEGQGRLGDGELRQFLSQARGSLFEIEAELIAARELGFVAQDDYTRLRQLCRRTSTPLNGLIAYVRRQEQKRPRSGRRSPATGDPAPAISP